MTFLPKSDDSIEDNESYSVGNNKYQRFISHQSYFLDKKNSTSDSENEAVKSKEDNSTDINANEKFKLKKDNVKGSNFFSKLLSRVSANKLAKSTSMQVKVKSLSNESIKSQH